MSSATVQLPTSANFTLERDGRKAILTFTREDRLNALDAQTFRDLLDAPRRRSRLIPRSGC